MTNPGPLKQICTDGLLAKSEHPNLFVDRLMRTKNYPPKNVGVIFQQVRTMYNKTCRICNVMTLCIDLPLTGPLLHPVFITAFVLPHLLEGLRITQTNAPSFRSENHTNIRFFIPKRFM